MALDPAIVVVTVNVGPPVDFAGNSLGGGTFTITPSRSLVHAASGTPLFRKPITIQLDTSGSASVSLPATDQAGFTDGKGGTVINWTYQAAWSFADASVPVPVPWSFALPSAAPVVDLDLVIPVDSSPGGTTSIYPVVLDYRSPRPANIAGPSFWTGGSLSDPPLNMAVGDLWFYTP